MNLSLEEKHQKQLALHAQRLGEGEVNEYIAKNDFGGEG